VWSPDRITSGYSIEKDRVMTDVAVEDKTDDHDFEHSITSADFLSDDSETDLVS